jgi:transcriptional regulator with PAS, ATPase and Fis domain
VPLFIPPLRERREDIIPLVDYFVKRLETKYNRMVEIPREVLSAFVGHDWPGNIRELENVIERMFVLSEGTMLDPALLPGEICSKAVLVESSSFKSQTEAVTRSAEKQMIIDALSTTAQNRTKAAQILGISRRTLQNKIKEYGL